MVVLYKGGSLLEYRCESCNKLLLKGLLLVSIVEIKCKKCGRICSYRWLDGYFSPDSYSVLIDSGGMVLNASANMGALRGVTWSDLVGQSLHTLLSGLGFLTSGTSIMGAWTLPDHSNHFFECESKLAQQDGGVQLVQLQWRFIKYGGNEYMILSMRTAEAATPAPLEEKLALQPAVAV